MKTSLHRITALFSNEIRVVSLSFSTMQFNTTKIGILTILFIVCSKSITEAHISLPFLRGGSTTVATAHTVSRQQIDNRQKSESPAPIWCKLSSWQKIAGLLGEKVQYQINKQSSRISQEWVKLSSNFPRFYLKRNETGSKDLDDVVRSFSSVLTGNNLDTALLLNACRAHLSLIKTGGAALRIVAKDLESNLQKAEALFKKYHRKGKYLSSLLEIERESGIHDGNMLSDPSAAVGMLWIRRSLSFQHDLYAALVSSNGQHPRDAAMDSYQKNLSPYHGWMLQKVFPMSLSQMPDREMFIAKFGGVEINALKDEKKEEIVKQLKSLVSTWDPILKTWKNEFERLNLEDVRRV